MTDPVDLSDDIATLAGQARSVTVDGQQVNRRGLQELIDADRYLASKAASARPSSILSFVAMVPPGGGE